jgi:hypothetical protein
MACQDGTVHIADYLAGTLSPEQVEAFRAHVATCAACRDDVTAAEETWQQLGRIPPMTPDLRTMRTRFDAMLDGYRDGRVGHPRRVARTALAAAAMLMLGIAIGRETARPAADPQLAAMRTELGAMRQMMSLSLLQQPSASARLQGVVSIGQIDDPGSDVIAALLDTLKHDTNANVRLATVDALKPFMDRDLVRRGTLDALPTQTSPLVQIALIDFVTESAGVEAAATLRTLSKNSMVEDAVRRRAAQRLQQLGPRS